ncbi:MAG: DUF2975 domain-containing protein [Oscillospiraceae bacterium]|nr:DUF2975 domain-containing protein [Oscillospiraceae bacterium]
MKREDLAIPVTLWTNRILMVAAIASLFIMPAIVRWLNTVRILVQNANIAILAGFYACAPFALWALWSVDELLRRIDRGAVFVTENVTALRRIRLCCCVVSVFCIAPSWFYPPLKILVVIMGFLTLMINVVCQVMKAAVAIREENDLTV